jgi:hypothetical protein
MAHIRRTNPEYLTAKHRKYMTGWTAAAFEGAWTSQGGKCANIGCGVLMLRRGWLDTSVTADHDHATKKTRGLLCRRCNRMAAKSTTPVVLRGLADYLEKHKG